MTYNEALSYIHSFRKFGKKAGLSKITRLLSLLDDPQKGLKFVHVAGTNGKGSIVAMTASVLRTAGFKTGMFISPFVVDFTERMQINGRYIAPDELARVTAVVKEQVDILSCETDAPSEFEVVTAIGLYWFREQCCDIVCLEVGLGGRFDPTNAIDTPLVAVIANIGLDHTAILGDTIEQIAAEKAGIIKEGGTVVCYPTLPPEVLGVIMEKAAQKNARVVLGNTHAARVLRDEVFSFVVEYGSLTLTLPLAGAHQIQNLICVLEVIGLLRNSGFAIPDDAVRDGIACVRFPARMEVFEGAPRIILDGAHNPQSAASVAAMASRVSGRRVLLYASLSHKDYRSSARILAPLFDEIVATQTAAAGGEDAETLSAALREYTPCCTPCADLPRALARALSLAGADGTLFICGSLFLASEVRPLLLKATQ
ncbi:MAG: folylpolyglutamate synthase/dihydrofolate synthase family protein [Acetanaerobacterium sp.]